MASTTDTTDIPPSLSTDAFHQIPLDAKKYHWATENNLYVQSQYLEELLMKQEGSNNIQEKVVVVVDCRDDDYVGGHIAGSIHIPESKFSMSHVQKILDIAAKYIDSIERTNNNDDLYQEVPIVFHCMESIIRGPRMACKFHAALHGKPSNFGVRICILQGGYDHWSRKHWNNPKLVYDYDDTFWGYRCSRDDRGEGV